MPRWDWDPEDVAAAMTYRNVVRLFADRPEAPFSIHNLTLAAKLSHRTKAGEWVGPTAAVFALATRSGSLHDAPLRIYVARESALYHDDIVRPFEANPSKDDFTPVFITIPIRLGIDSINPVYYITILDLFRIPYCMGIVGGRPRASYYFVGREGDSLLYLDPHTTQDLEEPETFPETGFIGSYQPRGLGRLPVSALDPSMALCFLCPTLSSVDTLLRILGQKGASGESLVVTGKSRPAYMQGATPGDDFSMGDGDDFDMDMFDEGGHRTGSSRPLPEGHSVVTVDDNDMVLM
eukprot:CAMPEP_0119144730 /NCGR_PEP_ID=MMETSP1310-20130426/36367_1 /TAXON_ID=464262 /ORGANISM="Genus nov. species nov., Strain RCC2339" /LENGTH=292 /DNA_ID=CAMNT_0007136501 /DNA_START=274 /DNA_END=1149 /DNA_ORIENTATION=+